MNNDAYLHRIGVEEGANPISPFCPICRCGT